MLDVYPVSGGDALVVLDELLADGSVRFSKAYRLRKLEGGLVRWWRSPVTSSWSPPRWWCLTTARQREQQVLCGAPPGSILHRLSPSPREHPRHSSSSMLRFCPRACAHTLGASPPVARSYPLRKPPLNLLLSCRATCARFVFPNSLRSLLPGCCSSLSAAGRLLDTPSEVLNRHSCCSNCLHRFWRASSSAPQEEDSPSSSLPFVTEAVVAAILGEDVSAAVHRHFPPLSATFVPSPLSNVAAAHRERFLKAAAARGGLDALKGVAKILLHGTPGAFFAAAVRGFESKPRTQQLQSTTGA